VNNAATHQHDTNASFESRRLQRALTHVSNFWFPPNAHLLGQIKTGLNDGRYELGMEFLLQDVKRDYALYMYLLRELAHMLRKDGVEVKFSEPLRLLESAGMERIRKILSVDKRAISQHDPEVLTEFQARQFEASLISASTAEVLCEHGEMAPDSAHLTALLRQLGLTLIAWNYPIVYQRALVAQSQDKNLDDLISEKLGFSPVMLAVTVVREWG
jgi:hypothetical protein